MPWNKALTAVTILLVLGALAFGDIWSAFGWIVLFWLPGWLVMRFAIPFNVSRWLAYRNQFFFLSNDRHG
jgi:hypothetical protein